jgi:hypothetical protein
VAEQPQARVGALRAASAARYARSGSQAGGAEVSTPTGPQERGQKTSNFKGDREKQVTQTAGANPDPPASRSRSAPADSVPPGVPADCLIGPYSGLDR